MQHKVVAFSLVLIVVIFCLILLSTFHGHTGVDKNIYSLLSNVADSKELYGIDNNRVALDVAVTSSEHPVNVSQMLAASAEEDYFRFVLLL